MVEIEEPIRVIVVDDQAIIRSGLGAFLMAFREMQLVGEANDGEEAVQLCEIVQPDVVLMDLKMPHMDGMTATREIHSRWPHIHVLILTSFKEKDLVENALEAGASGYLLKNITADELAESIHKVTEGHRILGREAVKIMDQGTPQSASPEEKTTLLIPSKPQGDEKMAQELLRAGKIQTDILPDKPPVIQGWDLCAKLEPARETSGDFYDFIPLTNGKWGLVIADVSDKGMGAALFMALTSTLIRTYTSQYPTLPGLAFSNINRRILSDTRGSMFVTAFYGVLDPDTGRLRYINAGHNPPYLFSTQRGKKVDRLGRTGMALGVMENTSWQQKIVKFAPGDMLLLYTDGVTEAQNRHGEFFNEQRLLEVARSKIGCTAQEMQDSVLKEVHQFTGNIHNQDDITLMILSRKP